MFPIFSGMWGAIAGTGAAELLAQEGIAEAGLEVLVRAHNKGWEDATIGGGLNNGQMVLADYCSQAGAEYLSDIEDPNDFDADEYAETCAGAHEASEDALSETIGKVASAIAQAASTVAIGLNDFLEDGN